MSATVIIVISVLVIQLVVIFGFVLLERRQPVATLAWILAVMLIPILGVVLYLLFGLRRNLKRRSESAAINRRIQAVLEACEVERKAKLAAESALESDRTSALVTLGERTASARASHNNAAKIYVDTASTYRALVDTILAATHHLHIEFYIIQPDETGIALRDQLARKAQEGVEVRVLCDAIGSIKLPSDFWQPLIKAGGEFAFYSPVRIAPRIRRRDRINYRNHRKIVVADGRVGLTGGINVGREYLGLDPDIGEWRDTHIRLEGPAVLGLQETFLEDWLVTTGNLLDNINYFPEPSSEPAGSVVAQVVPSGPDQQWAPIHQLYFYAINQANERVWITSPYFIPDRLIQASLINAALRGIDVRLLVPLRSDSRLMDYASRSYYGELLEAGVRIYQYARGFVHAKTLVVDRWMGTVGSANMDIRSFYINYELSAFLYGEGVADELARQFETDLGGAGELPRDYAKKLSYSRRILHAFAGLLSPLL